MKKTFYILAILALTSSIGLSSERTDGRDAKGAPKPKTTSQSWRSDAFIIDVPQAIPGVAPAEEMVTGPDGNIYIVTASACYTSYLGEKMTALYLILHKFDIHTHTWREQVIKSDLINPLDYEKPPKRIKIALTAHKKDGEVKLALLVGTQFPTVHFLSLPILGKGGDRIFDPSKVYCQVNAIFTFHEVERIMLSYDAAKNKDMYKSILSYVMAGYQNILYASSAAGGVGVWPNQRMAVSIAISGTERYAVGASEETGNIYILMQLINPDITWVGLRPMMQDGSQSFNLGEQVPCRVRTNLVALPFPDDVQFFFIAKYQGKTRILSYRDGAISLTHDEATNFDSIIAATRVGYCGELLLVRNQEPVKFYFAGAAADFFANKEEEAIPVDAGAVDVSLAVSLVYGESMAFISNVAKVDEVYSLKVLSSREQDNRATRSRLKNLVL